MHMSGNHPNEWDMPVLVSNRELVVVLFSNWQFLFLSGNHPNEWDMPVLVLNKELVFVLFFNWQFLFMSDIYKGIMGVGDNKSSFQLQQCNCRCRVCMQPCRKLLTCDFNVYCIIHAYLTTYQSKLL